MTHSALIYCTETAVVDPKTRLSFVRKKKDSKRRDNIAPPSLTVYVS